jgi:hypothetical protein
MNKIISLFLAIFPLLYFSQKENVTTSQASYPVTETKVYKKGSKKNEDYFTAKSLKLNHE